jgi:hypothetical protein
MFFADFVGLNNVLSDERVFFLLKTFRFIDMTPDKSSNTTVQQLFIRKLFMYVVSKNIAKNLNCPNENNPRGVKPFTFDLSLLKFAYKLSKGPLIIVFFPLARAQIGFLASCSCSRPSGDGIHNSKKVFRLFSRINIVFFLWCAVKIKKRKENIAVQMITRKFISLFEYFCWPSPHIAWWKIEKHRATIVKFIIPKNPQRFYSLSANTGTCVSCSTDEIIIKFRRHQEYEYCTKTERALPFYYICTRSAVFYDKHILHYRRK